MLKKAEKVCNEYIRQRDKDLPCISCASENANQAGHYISVRLSSYLRFDERNINRQCAGCNMWKHGNPIFYRRELVKKLGEFEVEKLERDAIENRLKKWTRSELQEIIEYYLEKLKHLRAA